MRGEPDIICITHLDFRDAELMQEGFNAHGAELQADFGDYTNIERRINTVGAHR